MDCEKKLYAIREVSEITGVKPVTLRAWQRRYNLIQPIRTSKGHRLYSDEDIALIQAVQMWLSKGVSIGKVKSLIERQVSSDEMPTDEATALDEVDAVIAALSSLHVTKTESIIHQVVKEYPLDTVIRQFIQPTTVSLSAVKKALRVSQLSLFNGLLTSKLESVVEAENKASQLGKCLLINLGSRDLQSRVWSAELSEQGWNMTILDDIEEVSGLGSYPLAEAYKQIALFSVRPLTSQQLKGLVGFREQCELPIVYSELLQQTEGGV
tara:strand:+ start:125 stop:925 length:801 start_codon:yes stop_codon:yes gene_type:complete